MYNLKLDSLNINESEFKTYEKILNYDFEKLSKIILNLTHNYIISILKADTEALIKVTKELTNYINLSIPEINNFISNCFLYNIFELLSSKHKDLNLFNIIAPELKILSKQDQTAEYFIKYSGYTEKDIKQIIEYNKHALNIYCLTFLGYKPYDLKNPLELPAHLKESVLLTINYTGADEYKTAAKFYYRLGFAII